jgi:hypothetical protein
MNGEPEPRKATRPVRYETPRCSGEVEGFQDMPVPAREPTGV